MTLQTVVVAVNYKLVNNKLQIIGYFQGAQECWRVDLLNFREEKCEWTWLRFLLQYSQPENSEPFAHESVRKFVPKILVEWKAPLML